MINRFVFVFYMKFMKLAEVMFHKFHINDRECKIIYKSNTYRKTRQANKTVLKYNSELFVTKSSEHNLELI